MLLDGTSHSTTCMQTPNTANREIVEFHALDNRKETGAEAPVCRSDIFAAT
jgi:hypothetical protein